MLAGLEFNTNSLVSASPVLVLQAAACVWLLFPLMSCCFLNDSSLCSGSGPGGDGTMAVIRKQALSAQAGRHLSSVDALHHVPKSRTDKPYVCVVAAMRNPETAACCG